jgi:enediyne biosynthesis protein E4
VQITAKDFDKNGSVDPVVTYYNDVEQGRFIVHNRLVLIDQIPSIKKRFETFRQYASTPFQKAFTDEDKKGALVQNVYSLSSKIFINNAGKSFTPADLPEIAQVSVINDILVSDLNHDGHQDLVIIGNNYSQETLFGRYDASYGALFLGDGKLNWKYVDPQQSGFFAGGDAKFIRQIRSKTGGGVVVLNNNAPLSYFLLSK